MRCLITGGTGFIGRALAPALIERGYEVVVLSRRAPDARSPARVQHVRSLAEAGAVQAVINLQGENLAAGRWSEARKREFVRSRVDFTRELVSWMGASPPAVMVSGSAIGWYGDRGDESLSEDSTPGGDFAAQLCRDWESAAQACEPLGVRLCRVRIGVVLDRDGGALARMLPPFRLGGGGPIGSGRQWMSWITRTDLVRLLLWLLETPAASGVYNGTAPQPVRNADFAKALGQALHRPAILPMPALAVRLLFGEMGSLLLGSQRVLPEHALREGFEFQRPDLPSALERILA